MKIDDIVRFGKYECRVLEISCGNALLLSEEMTELRAFHNKPSYGSDWVLPPKRFSSL